MAKLKLGPLVEDKPVKIAVEFSAAVYRDLVAYAEAHGAENGQPNQSPEKMIAPMLAMFMATDKEFAKARRAASDSTGG